MFEEIDGWNLIPGEIYYIKSPFGGRCNIGKALMIRYIQKSDENASGVFNANFGKCLIELRCWKFYRYVSDEEYKEKVKGKYDETCLNVILKRLIDDSFVW
uniref:Uncharacterized protein n=1 Tax=viral metagenome TaxID=1070528 RepID=A0A6C0D2P1_9ZZZZ